MGVEGMWRIKLRLVEVKMLKKVRFWCETILEKYYFNYQGREVR